MKTKWQIQELISPELAAELHSQWRNIDNWVYKEIRDIFFSQLNIVPVGKGSDAAASSGI